MATTDVDTVCTDAHLAAELGGADPLANLVSSVSDRKALRTRVLDDVLFALENRVPPICESDLTDITQLRRAVTYGSLAALFRQNITIGNRDDVASNMEQRYRAMYESHMNALRPTVNGGVKAGPSSIALFRG